MTNNKKNGIKFTPGNLRTRASELAVALRKSAPELTTEALTRGVTASWGIGQYLDFPQVTPRAEWRSLLRRAGVAEIGEVTPEAVGKAIMAVLPYWVEWLATGDVNAPLIK